MRLGTGLGRGVKAWIDSDMPAGSTPAAPAALAARLVKIRSRSFSYLTLIFSTSLISLIP